jgi:hypothetical protein
MSGRDRPVPPGANAKEWYEFLWELDRIEETVHPLGADDGALAEVVEFARAPLDLDDDGGDDEKKPPKTPPLKPRRRTRSAKSAARKKIVRMPTTFAEAKPTRASRARKQAPGRLVILPQEQRAATASGAPAAGLFEWYLQRERTAAKQARERRALAAAALPLAVVRPSTNGTTTVTTTITTTVKPNGVAKTENR